MGLDDGFNVRGTAVGYLNTVSVDDLSQGVFLCEVFINEFQKGFAYISFDVFIEGWVIPYNFPFLFKLLFIVGVIIPVAVVFGVLAKGEFLVVSTRS